MAKLYDLANVMRSKNAGPFVITIDLIFSSPTLYNEIKKAILPRRSEIAGLYGVEEKSISIHFFDRVKTVKVTMDRWGPSSGDVGDSDVYGAQQHGLMGEMEFPELEGSHV